MLLNVEYRSGERERDGNANAVGPFYFFLKLLIKFLQKFVRHRNMNFKNTFATLFSLPF